MSASRLAAALARLAGAVGAVVLLASPAIAGAPTLGTIGLGGPGCPAGSASASVSRDGSTLAIRFTRFNVAAGGGDSLDRKACSLAIPMTVPAGYSVALVGLTYRGGVMLPADASAQLNAETFFAGGDGPVASHTVEGPLFSSFTATTAAVAEVWSECGASTILRVNTSLLVRTPSGAPASASIRSQEVDAALVYQLKLRKC